MSEIKLLPCPFCGGEMEEPNNTSCKQGDTWLWSTECTNCGFFLDDRYKEVLIARVNNRRPLQRIIERLKEKAESIYKDKDKGEQFVFLNEAIKIVKEEGGIE